MIELCDVDEWLDVVGDKGEFDDVEDVVLKEVLFMFEMICVVACYVVFVVIAIGYDEMFLVFLKILYELGGCEFVL